MCKAFNITSHCVKTTVLYMYVNVHTKDLVCYHVCEIKSIKEETVEIMNILKEKKYDTHKDR